MVDKVNTVTVLRTALLAAIVAKAKANQEAYDKAVAEQNNKPDVQKQLDALFDKQFGKDALDSAYNPAGTYTKTNAKTARTQLFTYLGVTTAASVIPKPRLFEQEVAILTLATDDSLILPIGHNLLTVL